MALVLVACAALVGCTKKEPKPEASFRVEGANVAVQLSPASVLGSAFCETVMSDIMKMMQAPPDGKSPVEKLSGMVGIDVTKLAKVSVSGSIENKKFLVYAVSSVDLDPKSVIAAIGKSGPSPEKKETHKGVDLYAPRGEDEVVIAFPSKKTIVIGTIADVKKGIDNLKAGMAVPRSARVESLRKRAPAGAGIVAAVAITPELAKQAASGAKAGMVPIPLPMVPTGDDLEREMAKYAGFVLAVSAGSALDLTVVADMKTDASASETRKSSTEQLDALKTQMGPALSQPQLAPIKNVLDSIKIAGSGRSVVMTLSIKTDIVGAAQNLVPLIMKAVMGGGMPGGAPPTDAPVSPPGF